MTKTTNLMSCEGFHVLAEDGLVGEVEQPLVQPDRSDPDFLVVRLPRRRFRTRLPVVSTAIVSGFDVTRRLIWVRGSRREIASLPEHVPLAF
jgi:hypothetical protein